jgi:hypothetical protein
MTRNETKTGIPGFKIGAVVVPVASGSPVDYVGSNRVGGGPAARVDVVHFDPAIELHVVLGPDGFTLVGRQDWHCHAQTKRNNQKFNDPSHDFLLSLFPLR